MSAAGLFGEVTRRTGIGGHESSSAESEVWLTPPHVLAALGRFDLDPCAVMEPRPWPTAARHFTRHENGLIQPWHGRVWCNPPYGGPKVIGPWLRRMADHGCGTLLVFARTETAAFQAHVFPAASALLFLSGRLVFCRPDGSPAAYGAGGPSVLVAYGVEDARRLRDCGLPGALLVPEVRHG